MRGKVKGAEDGDGKDKGPTEHTEYTEESDFSGLVFSVYSVCSVGERFGCQPFLSNCASKTMALEGKSTLRTKAEASAAPWTRSMRLSSHSTERGPR